MIPVTDIFHDIEVITVDKELIVGESEIIKREGLSHNVASIKLAPTPSASHGALEAIKNADIIIL